MLNSKIERKAIYTVANYFTEIGWFFREQPILDFGLDAFVEIGEQGRPTGNFIALQVKGGKSNFHKSKEGLVFYFDETHKQYWLEVGKTFPVFIIIQDPAENSLFWGRITKDTIKKAPKNWKITIPFYNKLINTSKAEIENISTSHKASSSYTTCYSYLTEVINKKERVKTSFFNVNNQTEFGLQIILNIEGQERVVNLNYKPKKSEWDDTKKELKWNNPYCYTIVSAKKYIMSFGGTIEDTKSAIDEIENQINTGGISKLDEFLFNWNNKDNGVPKYSYFIEAFEHFLISKEKYEQSYNVRTAGEVIYFKTMQKEYVINTYEGKTMELKYFIEEKAYSEIYAMTNECIWSEIYLDMGIDKAQFIPVMHDLWEEYWDNLYRSIKKEVGKTDHLDKSKEKSWRQFQIFSESYNDIGDVIKYAYALSDMVIYPLAVASMMSIYNADVCYSEYCEYEFESEEWESICVDEYDYTKPIFYIQLNEI